MDALTAPLIDPVAADKANNIFQNVAPSWGNYLYQNVLPNLGTDWLLNANLGNGGNNNNNAAAAASPTTDLFSAAAAANAAAWGAPSAQQQQQQQPMLGQPGPSNYYMNYYGGSIAPSLLAPSTTGSGTPSGTSGISPSSLDMVDKIVASPSPMASAGGASPTSMHHHPHLPHPRGMFGRTHSVDSDADGEVDPEAETRSEHSQHSDLHDHDEGVERDGMSWGMKVDEYRALSARERKRVRNRISARTFRAKRKEHLSSLESTLGAKDLEIRLAHEENTRLRRELAEMKRRLQKYEKKPY